MSLLIDLPVAAVGGMTYLAVGTYTYVRSRHWLTSWCNRTFGKIGEAGNLEAHGECMHYGVGDVAAGVFWPVFYPCAAAYKVGRVMIRTPMALGVKAAAKSEQLERHFDRAALPAASVDHEYITQLENTELYPPISPE